MMNVKKEVARMQRMTVNELREKYAEVYGEGTSGRNKQWLIKRIAWRMQANEEGDLPERVKRMALEMANDADLRTTAPKRTKSDKPVATASPVTLDSRLPQPGTVLRRDYKGQTTEVTVLRDGFEFEGERYGSLSAVAKAITGKHWNGFHFFGLKKGGAK